MLPCGEGTTEGLREHRGSQVGLAEKEEDSDASHPTELQTPLRNPKDLEAQPEATSMEFLRNL